MAKIGGDIRVRQKFVRDTWKIGPRVEGTKKKQNKTKQKKKTRKEDFTKLPGMIFFLGLARNSDVVICMK